MVDQVNGVGAAGGVHAAGNVRRKPTQDEIEKNTVFYESTKTNITNYNEEAGASAIEKAKASYEVTNEQINALINKQTVLREVQDLELDQIARWFNGEAYIPGTEVPGNSTAKYLLELIKKQGTIDNVLDVDFGNGKTQAPKESSIKADYAIFKDTVNKNITDPTMKEMILLCDFTKEQKQELKDKLTEVTESDIDALCQEFGIKFDVSGIKNLDENCTPEDVATQLKLVNKLLQDLPDEVALDKIISEEQTNMRQNLDDVKGVSNTKLRLLQSGKPVGSDVQGEMAQYQKQNIDSFIKLQKAGLLKDLMMKIRGQVEQMQTKLQSADEELTQDQKIIDDGNAKKGTPDTKGLKKQEQDAQQSAQKAYAKAVQKTDNSESKVGKASAKNKKAEFEGQDKETSVQRNINKKDVKYQDRQTIEDKKREEKIKAEHQVKYNDVKEMLFAKLDDKNDAAFNENAVVEIQKLLNPFENDKFAQFSAVADLVKDKNLNPGEIKEMLKYAKDMDVTGLLPEEIAQLIQEKFDQVRPNAGE